MVELNRIRQLFYKLIKGLPILVGCTALAVIVATRVIRYMVPEYESVARIRLDDKTYGVSNTELFKDFDIFTTKNKVLAEVEMLKSRILAEKAVSKLDLGVRYYRLGRIRKMPLYKDNPIVLNFNADSTFSLYDRRFMLTVKGDESFDLYTKPEQEPLTGNLGVPINVEGHMLLFSKNHALIAERNNIQVADNFQIHIQHPDKIANEFVPPSLDVVPIDKSVAILRVGFRGTHPALAADFANALCQAYVDDYIQHKTKAARKSMEFLEEQIEFTDEALIDAELALEAYKKKNGVINTQQETETGLRKLSDLRKQHVNAEMSLRAMRELNDYVQNGNYFDETAPAMGTGDLLFTEMVKKMEIYRQQRKDLLRKYTSNHPTVVNIDSNIAQIAAYIKESIDGTLERQETQYRELGSSIEASIKEFEPIPQREREMHRLIREFEHQEMTYNYLSEKRTEASIAEAANISFHRILQYAEPPTTPVHPNKTLITFMAGLLGLVIGTLILIIYHGIRSTVERPSSLEENSELKLAGAVVKGKGITIHVPDFAPLAAGFDLQLESNQGVLGITSCGRSEGKTYVSLGLATAFSQHGYKTLLVLLDNEIPEALKGTSNSTDSKEINIDGSGFHTEQLSPKGINRFILRENIERWKKSYDRVVVDARAAAFAPEIPGLLTEVDIPLFVARTGRTQISDLELADRIAFQIKRTDIGLILNQADKSYNVYGSMGSFGKAYERRPKRKFRWAAFNFFLS